MNKRLAYRDCVVRRRQSEPGAELSQGLHRVLAREPQGGPVDLPLGRPLGALAELRPHRLREERRRRLRKVLRGPRDSLVCRSRELEVTKGNSI